MCARQELVTATLRSQTWNCDPKLLIGTPRILCASIAIHSPSSWRYSLLEGVKKWSLQSCRCQFVASQNSPAEMTIFSSFKVVSSFLVSSSCLAVAGDGLANKLTEQKWRYMATDERWEDVKLKRCFKNTNKIQTSSVKIYLWIVEWHQQWQARPRKSLEIDNNLHVTHTNHQSLLCSILVVSCRTGQHSGDHLLPVVTGLTSWHGAGHILFWINPTRGRLVGG